MTIVVYQNKKTNIVKPLILLFIQNIHQPPNLIVCCYGPILTKNKLPRLFKYKSSHKIIRDIHDPDYNKNFLLHSARIFVKALHLLLSDASFIIPDCFLTLPSRKHRKSRPKKKLAPLL